MAKRRIIYLIAALLIVFIFYQLSNSNVINPPNPLSQRALIAEFREFEITTYLPDTETEEGWVSQAIYFPPQFTGISDDAFYVLVGNSTIERQYTLYFTIRTNITQNETSLQYHLRDTWKDTAIPVNLEYTCYDYGEDRFV